MNKQTKQQFVRQGERGDFGAIAKVLDEVANPASPVPLPAFAVAGLPSAALWTGHLVYCTNGAAGDPMAAFSDGTDWLRVDTGAAVAAE